MLGLVTAGCLMGAVIITRTSQFPQVTTPHTNDLVLLSVAGSNGVYSIAAGATNNFIRWDDLQTAIRNGLLPNSLNTNVLGTNLVWDPAFNLLTINGSGPMDGFFVIRSNGVVKTSFGPTGNVLLSGALALSDQTNRLTIAGGALLLDGVPIGTLAGFDLSQFGTNGGTVSIKSGPILTNLQDTATTHSQDAVVTNTFQAGYAAIINNAQIDGQLNVVGTTYGGSGAFTNALTLNGSPVLTNASGGLLTNGSAYIIVGGSAVATANWIQLTNAYLAAKSATPHGNPLLTGNRYTIYLLAGVYDAGANTLLLDADYIDLIGLSTHTGLQAPLIAGGSSTNDLGGTMVQGSGIVLSMPATVTAANSDMALMNLTLYSTGGVTFSPGAGGTGDRFNMRNVLIKRNPTSTSQASMADVVYRGYFYNVRCPDDYAFGYSVAGSAQSTWILCSGGRYAWGGYSGTHAGRFWYCNGGDSCFGINGFSGVAYYCSAINAGFGSAGPFTGEAYYCNSGSSGGAFGGAGGTMSGTLVGCYSSGTFAPTSVTGTIKNCSLSGWSGPYTMNTADSAAISNTNIEVNFSVTKTIAPSDWVVGRAFTWQARGKLSNDATTPVNLTLNFKLGSTIVNTTGALTLLTGATNKGWTANGLFVCRTVGATGTISSQMDTAFDSSVFIGSAISPSNGVSTNNMTASLTAQLSATWSVIDTDNSITLENFLVDPQPVN